MPRGDKLTVQLIRTLEQRLPLDMGVAEHTRIRSPAGQVLLHKLINHKITELTSDVKDVMREAISHGERACIINAVQAATARLLGGGSRRRVIPCFHGQPDHFIPLLMKHYRGNRAVNPPAHRNQYSSSLAHFL